MGTVLFFGDSPDPVTKKKEKVGTVSIFK